MVRLHVKKNFLFQTIPQFDFSILSVVLLSSLMSVTVYYTFIALQLLPEIITILKFRTKKLIKKTLLNPSLIFLPNIFSYYTGIVSIKKN